MSEPWGVIVGWLENHCPAEAAKLWPPATEADLRAAEAEVGAPLPADLLAWWRSADGFDGQVSLFPVGYTPYSVRDALSSRRTWLEVSAEGVLATAAETAVHTGVQAGTPCYGAWLPRWLPIAGNGSGDDFFVDLRPGPMSGCVGTFRHEEWEYVQPRWPSVTAMLTEVAEALVTAGPIDGWRPQVADGRLAWEYIRPRPRISHFGGMPVTRATPAEAGIHPAIRVDHTGGELPAYVPRDVDTRLRDLLAEAAERGGFVLVTGPPLAGKTRTLYEAVAAVLPGWELIPTPHEQHLMIVARAGRSYQVVWMDDMRADRFGPSFLLDGVRRLRRPGAVVVGTCLPEQWEIILPPALVGQPFEAGWVTAEGHIRGRRPDEIRIEQANELAALTTVLELPSALSPAEQAAAVAAGAGDGRIRAALADPGGLVPALAAGPALVRRWEQPDDRNGWAFVTAAADARRVGCRTLNRDLLVAAARGYLNGTEPGWEERGLSWATAEPHGAAAALTETSARFTMGNYLYDHVRRGRAAAQLPERAWQALVDQHDPLDSFALAEGAVSAGRPEHAEVVYRRMLQIAADTPDDPRTRGRGTAALNALLPLLAAADRVDEAIAVMDRHVSLTGRVDTRPLTELLARHGRADELRRRSDDGDHNAASHLTMLLARTGDLDGLRERATHGDSQALFALMRYLTEHHRADEATTLLRELADAGNELASALLDQMP